MGKKKRLFFGFIFFLLAVTVFSAPNAISLLRSGQQEQLKEDYYRAIEYYKEALKINPSFVEPMIGLSECFNFLGQYDEALRYVLEAKKHDRNNLQLANLEAIIRTGLGEMDSARQIYAKVLSVEPNNLEARFGLAGLDLADGKRQQAAVEYKGTLKTAPGNKRALLSLALLYEETGDRGESQDYLDLALKYYNNDPKVHYTAGRLYLLKGEYEQSIEYLKISLALKPGYEEARELLGEVYLIQNRASEAVDVLKENLISQISDRVHRARYSMGLAYGEMEMIAEALNSLASALRLKPEDEVARIAAENIALKYPDKAEKWRKEYARFHLREGQKLEEKNLLEKALIEYRRSIRLDPSSAQARLAYARIHRIRGFPIKYLMELLLLKNYYKVADTKVLDDIEVYERLLDTSLATRWADTLKPFRAQNEIFDQYSIEKSAVSLLLLSRAGKNDLFHPLAARELTLYVQDLFMRYDTLKVSLADRKAESFDSAFRQAREAGKEYFLLASYDETERSFQVDCTLYLTRTGSLLRNFSVYRTGNDRIKDGLLRITAQILESFPVKGKILAREFDSGIVDLGTVDRVAPEMEFLIIKKGKLNWRSDEIGFAYGNEDVLGRLVITRVDENIAEGKISPSSFFDRINPGDEVVSAPKKQ